MAVMRIIYIHILAVALLSSSVVVKAQDTFENLNFELANPGTLTHEPPYSSFANNVPVANALPYWSVFYGDVQQSTINVNDPSLGATAVTLYTTGYPVIDGNYSALLQGGLLYISDIPASASISQTGLIPAGMQSLLFEAQPGRGTLDVAAQVFFCKIVECQTEGWVLDSMLR
jgi:hypothetical protein